MYTIFLPYVWSYGILGYCKQLYIFIVSNRKIFSKTVDVDIFMQMSTLFCLTDSFV